MRISFFAWALFYKTCLHMQIFSDTKKSFILGINMQIDLLD